MVIEGLRGRAVIKLATLGKKWEGRGGSEAGRKDEVLSYEGM